jgi:hypothetical protein
MADRGDRGDRLGRPTLGSRPLGEAAANQGDADRLVAVVIGSKDALDRRRAVLILNLEETELIA